MHCVDTACLSTVLSTPGTCDMKAYQLCPTLSWTVRLSTAGSCTFGSHPRQPPTNLSVLLYFGNELHDRWQHRRPVPDHDVQAGDSLSIRTLGKGKVCTAKFLHLVSAHQIYQIVIPRIRLYPSVNPTDVHPHISTSKASSAPRPKTSPHQSSPQTHPAQHQHSTQPHQGPSRASHHPDAATPTQPLPHPQTGTAHPLP
jgi:hypothetical protein